MLTYLFIAATIASAPPHPCLGDFVYQGSNDGISIGVRMRTSPDHAEILFSDYGNVQSPSLSWEEGAVRITDQQDGSDIVVVCSAKDATLILPADQWSSARTFKLRRTNGSLWEVGAREGWLEPGE